MFAREFVVISNPEKLESVKKAICQSDFGVVEGKLPEEFSLKHLYYKDPSCTISRKNLEPLIASI